MPISQVTPTAATPPTPGPSNAGASAPNATGSNASKNFSAAAATPSTKSDNDAVKVSISDTAAKLLAANKKVNPDGTVGPHHKARHPHAAVKPIA
jgi:hypothetical protein